MSDENNRAAETTETERSHHAESASGLQTKEWCPRFKNMSGTSDAAELGTKQHYAAETGDLTGLDDLQAMKVQDCIDFIENRYKDIHKKFPDAEMLAEQYGTIDEIEWPTMNERSTSGGFVDVEILFDGGKKAEIWDYKFGRWEVEPAENNLQGIVYLLNRFKKNPQLEECTVGFLMPYLDKIDYHTFYRKDFPMLYTRVKRLVMIRQHGKNLEENPSFNTCMWCANMINCKKLTSAVVQAAQKFAPLKVPANTDPNSITEKSDISAWLQFSDVLKAYAAAVRHNCTELVLETEDLLPESHDLVNQTMREVKDATLLVKSLEEFGVPANVIDRIRKITLTDAEKAVGDTAERGHKTAQIDLFKESLNERGVVGPGTVKIFLKAKRVKAE